MLYRLSYVGQLENKKGLYNLENKKKRAMGIEPTLSAWKAEVLPLNYARFGNHKFGGGRIRTFEGVSRQIYSLIPLAAREPLHKVRREFCLMMMVMSIINRKLFA